VIWSHQKCLHGKEFPIFGKKGKLSPRYMGPPKVLKMIGKVSYELELPKKLSSVHPIFHVDYHV